MLLERIQQQAEEMKSQEEEMPQNIEELSATQEEMQRGRVNISGASRSWKDNQARWQGKNFLFLRVGR